MWLNGTNNDCKEIGERRKRRRDKNGKEKKHIFSFVHSKFCFLVILFSFSRKIKENDITKKQNLELIILGYMNDPLMITIIPIWEVKVGPCHIIKLYFGLPLDPLMGCLWWWCSTCGCDIQLLMEMTPPPPPLRLNRNLHTDMHGVRKYCPCIIYFVGEMVTRCGPCGVYHYCFSLVTWKIFVSLFNNIKEGACT